MRCSIKQIPPLKYWSMPFAALIGSVVCLAADSPSGASTGASKSALKLIKPEDAKDYDGKEVIVEFKVAAAFEADVGVCFLNSTIERDDPKKFTAFISHDALLKFRQNPKTQKPADYFKNKRVRVTGTIKLYKKQYEIEVGSPDQIKLVEEQKESGSPGQNQG